MFSIQKLFVELSFVNLILVAFTKPKYPRENYIIFHSTFVTLFSNVHLMKLKLFILSSHIYKFKIIIKQKIFKVFIIFIENIIDEKRQMCQKENLNDTKYKYLPNGTFFV